MGMCWSKCEDLIGWRFQTDGWTTIYYYTDKVQFCYSKWLMVEALINMLSSQLLGEQKGLVFKGIKLASLGSQEPSLQE